MILDLREVGWTDWLKAVFDHPVPVTRNADEWYWDSDLQLLVNPRVQIEFFARMCSEPGVLLDLFTLDQIDQGLWYIFGAGGEDDFSHHLWNADVPWAIRQRAISSIPKLWPGLFERADVGSMSHMIWDSLAYDYDGGPLYPEGDAEAKRVQDAMFRALTEQLVSDVAETQSAALHGLGHLRHPSTARELRSFLVRPSLDEDVRAYARAIMQGKPIL